MQDLKSLVLFILAIEADFLNPTKQSFAYHDYSYIYQRLDQFKKSSIRGAVLQLVEEGDIDKLTSSAKPSFRLTERGRSKLLQDFPLYQQQKKVWDRKWRIALIRGGKRGRKPENRTERITNLRDLRTGLRELGFRQFIRGVYLTPFPIEERLNEFLLENKFTPFVTVFVSDDLMVGDNKQLAFRLWNLESLIDQYQDLSKKVDKLIINIKGQNNLKGQVKKDFNFLIQKYYQVLKKDPGLPRQLLIDQWPGDTLQRKFLELTKLVEDFK